MHIHACAALIRHRPRFNRLLPPPPVAVAAGDRSHCSPAIEERERALFRGGALGDPAELGQRVSEVAAERRRAAVPRVEAAQVCMCVCVCVCSCLCLCFVCVFIVVFCRAYEESRVGRRLETARVKKGILATELLLYYCRYCGAVAGPVVGVGYVLVVWHTLCAVFV